MKDKHNLNINDDDIIFQIRLFLMLMEVCVNKYMIIFKYQNLFIIYSCW